MDRTTEELLTLAALQFLEAKQGTRQREFRRNLVWKIWKKYKKENGIPPYMMFFVEAK